MTDARAVSAANADVGLVPSIGRLPELAFRPIVRLDDGAAFGVHADTEFAFEDTCSLRHMSDAEHPSAAQWLGDVINRACRSADDLTRARRPISVTAPLAALSDRDSAMAAEAGARRSGLLPQEVRIDFIDGSVCALDDIALDRLESFMRRGFRIGLDARRSWKTSMGARARALFEAVRIDPSRFEALDIQPARLEVCAGEGVAIIADNVRWRDCDHLATLGVRYAVAPRADA